MAEINTNDLTTSQVGGTGVFDQLMLSSTAHLLVEYNKNRIKGTEYSKVYLGAMDSAMSQSIAFILGRQRADKEADLIDEQIGKAKEETLLVIAQTAKLMAETDLTKEQTKNAVKQGVILDLEDDKVQAEIDLMGKQEDKMDQEILMSTQQVLNLQYEGDVLQLQDDKIQEEIYLIQENVTKTAAEARMLIERADNYQTEIDTLIAQKEKLEAEVTILEHEAEIKDQEALAALLLASQAQADLNLTNAKSSLTLNQAQVTDQEVIKLGAETSFINAKKILLTSAVERTGYTSFISIIASKISFISFLEDATLLGLSLFSTSVKGQGLLFPFLSSLFAFLKSILRSNAPSTSVKTPVPFDFATSFISSSRHIPRRRS